MVNKFNENANVLATEYWRLKGINADKASEDKLDEIEELLEKGIGGKLREKLDAEAKQLRKEKEDRSSAVLKVEEVKKEILELTADFAPNLDSFEGTRFPYDSEHEPISEAYFSALTDSFLGKPQPSIQFKEATFSTAGIEIHSEENSPLKVLGYIIMIIQEAAKHMLGMENKINKSYMLLKQNGYALSAWETLIKEGRRLRIKEIKDISHHEDKEYKELVSDDTYDKELVNGVVYLVSGERGYNLAKEYDGEYEATDFGEWVWQICNIEVSKEEGGGKREGKRKSISGSSLNIHKMLKFFKK